MQVIRATVDRADAMGATDANYVRITSIDSQDALGYRGTGREEHSGENAPGEPKDPLADNGVGQLR